ncbi:12248_t:CDS:1 [Dentiscutata heterogama]|uniref:12248_t:CDS:1 n=1 Tax=Dentiscutata heterogama TaxID=1316150 RepID=A0ACA9LN16_9GLOM|nr:12248_t:CDS:1 [Dentiscutata heterogama]
MNFFDIKSGNVDNCSNAFDLGAQVNFFDAKFSDADNCSNALNLGALVNCFSTLDYSNLETFFDAKSGNTDNYTFDFGDSINFFNLPDFDNLEAYLNAFGPSDIEAFLNIFDPSSLVTFFERTNNEKDNDIIENREDPQIHLQNYDILLN